MKKEEGFFSNLKYDFPASIVVFLVAMPLCLGIAMASGAPLFSGLIAGMIGGIVVPLISRSSLGVSGPAAGLTVIVLGAINDLGSFETFLLAVIIAGVIQIILGFLKAGVIGYYFPSAVIKGMLSGIGIIIFLKQIPHAFGYDADPEGDFSFAQSDGHNTLSEFYYMLENITPAAMIISAVSLFILILWDRPFMKNHKATRLIQGPLVVVLLGITMNVLFDTMGWHSLAPEHLVTIPVATSIGGFFSQFTFPDFTQLFNSDIYVTAFTIAIVASLETLLCVEATDKLDPQKRITPVNRELLGQGVGNIVSGLIGGLPLTQVIVRSSANIQSGGRTRASAFIHGILLFVSALSIPFVLNMIPLASLAAILLVVGYKLMSPKTFKDLYLHGPGQFVPFIVTIVTMVFTDLLIGIGLGLVVGIFQILYNNYRVPYHFDEAEQEVGKPAKIRLSEDVSFLNKAGILRTLNSIPEGCKLIIDASKTKNIHPDILEIIEDFQLGAKNKDIEIQMIGITDEKSNGGFTDPHHLVLAHAQKNLSQNQLL
jgi:MFS superfamily sulfate permease-like transporter